MKCPIVDCNFQRDLVCVWVAANAFFTAAGSCGPSARRGVGGRCLFSGKRGEPRSIHREPVVCLEYFNQHLPACVREPCSPLHSCPLTKQDLLHSVSNWEVSVCSPSPSPSPLPTGGKGMSSWGRCRRALPCARPLPAAAHRTETLSWLPLSRGKNSWIPAQDRASLSRIQGLEAICPPSCVCATSADLPT